MNIKEECHAQIGDNKSNSQFDKLHLFGCKNLRKITRTHRQLVAVNGKLFTVWNWIKPVQILLLGD